MEPIAPELEVEAALARASDRHRQRIVGLAGAAAALSAVAAAAIGVPEAGPIDAAVLAGQAVLGAAAALASRRATGVALVLVCAGVAATVGWFGGTGPDRGLAVTGLAMLLLLWFTAGPRQQLPHLAILAAGIAVGSEALRPWSPLQRWWASVGLESALLLLSIGLLAWSDRRRADHERSLLRTALLTQAHQDAQAFVLRQAAERAASAARVASELKTEFLARISHELRTPLNAILGYSELIEEDEDTPAFVREDTARIRTAATRLLELVDQVLDLSSIEAGRMDVRIEEIGAPALLGPVLDAVKPLLEAQGNRLYAQVPDVVLRVDPGRVRQVLLNLLSNAARFTTGGSVELRVRVAPQLVRFDVIDTGIGIRPDRLDHLFQPFVQAERETSIRYGGTGLGLVLSERTVRAMAGRMEVESEVGTGSRFSVVLPMPDAPQRQELTPSALRPAPDDATRSRPPEEPG